MRTAYIVSLASLLICTGAHSQDMTLQAAIRYAGEHNIDIRESVLDERLAKLRLQQSNLSQLPNVNVAAASGRSYGSTIDPASLNTTDMNYNFTSFVGNADLLLFGWFRKRNQIQQNKLSLAAAQADQEQVKNDVLLNVTAGFLRALQAKEQVKVSEKRISFTKTQISQARQQARAGTQPDLGVTLLEAQVSTDSANLMMSVSSYNNAILDMKALLDMDYNSPITISIPDIQPEREINISLTPEQVYAEASKHFGSLKSTALRYEAAQKQYRAARGALFPQLDLIGQVGTVYTDISKNYTVTGYNNVTIPSTYIDVNGTPYPVYQNTPTYSARTVPFGDQLKDNMVKTVALSLNIPIFNGWRTTSAVREAQVNLQSQSLKKEKAEMSLKKEIYKAYDEMKVAMQRYTAAQNAATSSEKALFYIQKRYSLGLATALDYLTVENSLYNSNFQLLSAKYDLIFKLKTIDYYMGREVKL